MASIDSRITLEERWLKLSTGRVYTPSPFPNLTVSICTAMGKIFDGPDPRIEHQCRFLSIQSSSLGLRSGGKPTVLTMFDTFTVSSKGSVRPAIFTGSVRVL